MEILEDFTRRTASDKILFNKAFHIDKKPKYDGYQCGIVSRVYKIFDNKSSGGAIKNDTISNKELAEKLHKTFI